MVPTKSQTSTPPPTSCKKDNPQQPTHNWRQQCYKNFQGSNNKTNTQDVSKYDFGTQRGFTSMRSRGGGGTTGPVRGRGGYGKVTPRSTNFRKVSGEFQPRPFQQTVHRPRYPPNTTVEGAYVKRRSNFYCCSCERSFKTEDLLVQHNQEHIICGLDGCTFEAHSLVVTKHIRMQHEGNLFERMKNLKTPEDIEKWRQDRLKNFPTLAKQQKKEEQKQDVYKLKRNPFETRPFRYTISQQTRARQAFSEYWRKLRWIEYNQSDQWIHRKFAPDPNARHIRVPFFSMNKSEIVIMENFYLSVMCKGQDDKLQRQTKVKWRGVKAKTLPRLPDSDNEDDQIAMQISDSDDEESSDKYTVAKRKICGATGSTGGSKADKKPSTGLMLVNYSSGSETDEKDYATSKPVVPAGKSDKVDSDTDDMSTDDNSMIIREFTEDRTFKDVPVYEKGISVNKRTPRFRKPDLLERLLDDQIRKERNVILQACQYVCKNNFFQNK